MLERSAYNPAGAHPALSWCVATAAEYCFPCAQVAHLPKKGLAVHWSMRDFAVTVRATLDLWAGRGLALRVQGLIFRK